MPQVTIHTLATSGYAIIVRKRIAADVPDVVDRIRASAEPPPMIAVGGGSNDLWS